MNKIQIALFLLYVLSMWVAGSTLWQLIRPEHKALNRAWYLGEGLLLGGIVIVTEMLLLSLAGLYKAPFLWGIVICNFGCLFLPQGRKSWAQLKKPLPLNPAAIIFLILVAIFMFRNCYFLVDVDSHSTYLYAQKLWLEHGSSIFASPAMDMKVFVPQFNAVPYALGLSIFPAETLFPQLVVAFWTVILLLLVYGYVSFRLSPVYGLAAAMLTLFNDHMYFSGANSCCIINSALIAVLFASAVNFWEAGRTQDGSRIVLALIFWAQIMANKYQLFYVFVFLGVFGFLIQPRPWKTIKEVIGKPYFILAVLFSVGSLGLWFIKNWLATGAATFPVFAGELGALRWTKEMAHVFNQHLVGPLPFSLVIKYFSYMFFWPGVNAAKVLIGLIIFFPLIVFGAVHRKQYDREIFQEMSYWLTLSVVVMIAIPLVNFVDPRNYRYGIALIAVAVVIGLHFLLRYVFKAPRFLEITIILLIAVQGWGIMLHQGGDFKRPFIHDNWLVLTDHLHMKEMMYYYYPANAVVEQELPAYKELFASGAWDIGVAGVTPLSAFLLPTRPQVGLWYTTAVRWDSYSSPMLVAMDLSESGINWVMGVRNGHMYFENPLQYGQRAAAFDRHPSHLFYNYNFPEELSVVRY